MILNNGIIINGEYAGWEIEIVDDTHGDTGGFYLILRSKDAQSFDYWFEKKSSLTINYLISMLNGTLKEAPGSNRARCIYLSLCPYPGS